MRLREQSQIGWLMAQVIGAKSLPHVTREAQRVSRARAGTDSASSLGLPQTRSPGPAPNIIAYRNERLAEKLPPSNICSRCGALLGGMYGTVCMNCDVEPVTVQTFSTTESLWWLSYADEHRCAGVAIVRVTGAQTAEHAADVARGLGLTPEGEWQVAAIQVPEEERALAEACVGRLLTTAEATEVFAAKSIKNHEAETGLECDWEAAGVQVVDP